MTRKTVIRCQGVGKSFRVYAQPADRLLEAFTRRPKHAVFTAVRGVDLEIRAGETVGIVGRNGSGKSTLLQLIAGTLQPTEGEIEVQGRVAALLELGSGFNPDFSGRENVYLNAQVLGLRRHEVEARLERIERFADIGSFIDQPVRTYSSGMLVRLAFAVAVNTDPDILIIDEALAVGDEAFQRKCFARIEEIRSQGATILFVSHSASSVVNLCDRAVLLDDGEVLLVGQPKTVVEHYQRLLHAPPEARVQARAQIRAKAQDDTSAMLDEVEVYTEGPHSPGLAAGVETAAIGAWPVELTERFDADLRPASTVVYAETGARISNARLLNAEGKRVNILIPGRSYVYVFDVEMLADGADVEFGMTIKSIDGIALFGMSSHGRLGFIPMLRAGSCIRVEFRFCTRFRPGVYYLNAGCQGQVGERPRDFLHRVLDADCFRIEGPETDRYTIGFYDLSVEPAAAWCLLDAERQEYGRPDAEHV